MGARGKRNPGQLVEGTLLEEELVLVELLLGLVADLVGEQDEQRT